MTSSLGRGGQVVRFEKNQVTLGENTLILMIHLVDEWIPLVLDMI